VEGDFPDRLEKALSIPVFAVQDSRAAALGEYLCGAGKGAETLISFTLGTGIGTGILLGGRIYHGALRAAGEIGHLPVIPNGRSCGCGKRGCLEKYAAGGGLDISARELLGADATAHTLFSAARAGDARAAADQVFAELAEMRKEQAKAERMMNANEARAELRRKLNEAEDAVSHRDARQEPIPKPSRPIQVGDLVEIPGVRQNAEVVSVGKDGTLQLKSGILKMKAKADEVRLIEDDERAAQKKKVIVSNRQDVDRTLRASASRELDIRGMETLEAESVVESFLSAAVMGRLDTVTIIHGKGTGALRKAVHDILRRNKKVVKDFRLGVYGEGESGVTVVTLK
jgi:DNA-nicking Smr family endonuclease